MEYKEISYAEFEIIVDIPKYLTTATADVWYDLTGTFFIYSVKEKQFLTTLLIKNNGEEYHDIAKFLYGQIMRSRDFVLLKPLDPYRSYYFYNKGKFELLSKYSKTFDNGVPSMISNDANVVIGNDYFIKSGLVDCSNKSICLVCDSWRDIDYDEFYVVDQNNRKLYHAEYFDHYDEKPDTVIDRHEVLDIANSKDGFLALQPLKFSRIYEYSDSELKLLKCLK